jgi:DNA (cytosine-5)-methyltransferase 1
MNLLELFAGAGGAALGLKAAGYDGMHYEWDPSAFATLQAAGFHGYRMDVRKGRWSGYSRHYGAPHLLWASPPCQAFSQAGKGLGATDPRNGWPWTLDAAARVDPTWVVCENVPGLLHHSKESCGNPMRCAGCYWEQCVVPEFRMLFPWVGVWKLNAADYGVPQTRRRVFLVAGPHPIAAPQPTHAAPHLTSTLFGELKPWVSIGEALGLGAHQVLDHGQTNVAPAGRPAHTLHTADGGPVVLDHGNKGSVSTTDQPSHTVRNGNGSGPLLRPAPTVMGCEVKGSGKGANATRMQKASDALYLGTGRRRLTVAECAKLQGFPDGHPFQGTKAEQYKQVGNACCPIVVQKIVEQIPPPPKG